MEELSSLSWRNPAKYRGLKPTDIAALWRRHAKGALKNQNRDLARACLSRAKYWDEYVEWTPRPISRILRRVEVHGKFLDLMECGHLLQARKHLKPSDVAAARFCTKCELESPPDVKSVLGLSEEAKNAMYWKFFYAERGTDKPVIPPLAPVGP